MLSKQRQLKQMASQMDNKNKLEKMMNENTAKYIIFILFHKSYMDI